MTRKSSRYRPRPVGLHRFIADGAERIRRKVQADDIARPMREMFALLATGEVYEVDGVAVMAMPELDPSLRQSATDWVGISAAAFGWIDLWEALATKLRQDKLQTLAQRLRDDKPLTPRLVDLAKEQFEAAIAMIPDFAPGAIGAAITETRAKWAREGVEAMTDTTPIHVASAAE